ncbi:lysophospholipid acyltransferase family protein [Agaribacterium sp. ZY112]|uniref:lysophospholipid acyltransferase family protein n=1 Tax=Agaribacterium sp. ZY112 TaxID=3233574 RepID=UPI0035238030
MASSPFIRKCSFAGLQLLGSLPLFVARGLGSFFGATAWLINGRERWVTEKNIERCLPNLSKEEQRKLAKQSLKETGKVALEMLLVWHRNQAWLNKRVLKIDGEELLKNAVEAAKGVIVVGPHLGNWEVLGKCLPAYGDVSSLYQPPKQQWLEDFVKHSREASGAQLVPTTARGVAALLGRLKKGQISGILPDQVPDEGSGEYAPFFTLPAYTMSLIHGLIKRTGCEIIMAYACRVDGGFEIRLRKPDELIYSEDQQESLVGLNKSVEALVLECPEQYQWEYKRFKKQPVGGEGKAFYRR